MCNSTIGFVIQFVNVLLEHACCVNFANKFFVSRFTPVVVVFFCTHFVIDKLVFRAVFPLSGGTSHCSLFQECSESSKECCHSALVKTTPLAIH